MEKYIYFGNDIVMKSSVFGGKRMIEEINYKVQNGDKDYTNSTSLSATNRKFKQFIFLNDNNASIIFNVYLCFTI